MLGYYNYTVILTYLGMLVSFTGIVSALQGNLQTALLCLMVSGLCDMFDGKIASTRVRTASEKRFGIQIDSLSDLVCFGVLPAIIVCQAATATLPVFCLAGAYVLCALIRLAYFNVNEEERQSQTQAARTVYLGLPVTTAALIVPAVYGLGLLWHWPLGYILPAVLLVMGVAFLTPFRLKKPARAGKVAMIVCGLAELCILVAVVRL
jgi:CDP-diacylglycerol--serine O-phosphatidyltransferase